MQQPGPRLPCRAAPILLVKLRVIPVRAQRKGAIVRPSRAEPKPVPYDAPVASHVDAAGQHRTHASAASLS
jgi:hypothetical protein